MADCSNSEKDCQQRTGIVYKITNLEDGKVYVGQTVQRLRRRLNQHKNAEAKSISAIDGAIKKYGWENFKAEVLEECPREMLNEREKFWIEKLNCLSPNGYNLTSGGDGGYIRSEETLEKMRLANEGKTLSDETKAKISEANQGENNPFYGKTHSEETRAKISAVHKGKTILPETRAKMSEAHKNPSPETRAKLSAARTGEKNPFYDKHHTPETKAKMSVTRKGRQSVFLGKKHTEESKAKMSESHKGQVPWNKGLKLFEKKNADIAISLFEDDNN